MKIEQIIGLGIAVGLAFLIKRQTNNHYLSASGEIKSKYICTRTGKLYFASGQNTSEIKNKCKASGGFALKLP
jgi:hypothetical protein